MPANQRTTEEIRREIVTEREQLEASLNKLGNDVEDMILELRREALELANKALVVAPIAGAAAGALVAAGLLRRRAKRRRRR